MMKVSDPRRSFRARQWSNAELRRLTPLFGGDVVNVSAWEDRDKEGGFYADYFTAKSSYSVTNYPGERGHGNDRIGIDLDLEARLPPELIGRFDVVFNHTTLEHVFDLRTAIFNLCQMSRDSVIVVVPFAQIEHYTQSFGDYWRFTPMAVRRLFEAEGFQVPYLSAIDEVDTAVYILAIAMRNPALHTQLPSPQPLTPLAKWLGRPNLRERAAALAYRKFRCSTRPSP